jgi:(2Fe-2S) ferredoxin
MAKQKAGLPDGYDLRVTSSELKDAPASLSGYLDDERPQYIPPAEPVRTIPQQIAKPAVEVVPSRVSYQETVSPKVREIRKEEVSQGKPQREKVRRLQINISPDVERKGEELLELLGRQSPDGRVTVSELMQALILNLYDARDNINGRLPERGRWGTSSAKSYPAELAIVLREAILKDGKGKGMGAFRTAVGQ